MKKQYMVIEKADVGPQDFSNANIYGPFSSEVQAESFVKKDATRLLKDFPNLEEEEGDSVWSRYHIAKVEKILQPDIKVRKKIVLKNV